MGFGSAVDRLRLPILLLLALQRRLETLFDEALPQTLHRTDIHIEGIDNLCIGPVLAMLALIRFQKDPGVPLLVGGCLPRRDQATKMGAT
jgi:hypothetical protein